MQIKDSTLEKHLANKKLVEAYLLVDKDILKLKRIAEWFSGGYNTADVFWLVPEDGASTIQVKGAEAFINRTSLAAISDKKLFIICDTAVMTPAAQNKILKTIEDNTLGNTFLLLASTERTVLNTIKSRCVLIYPMPLTDKQILGEYPKFPAQYCDGTFLTAAMYTSNPNADKIYKNAALLLNIKSLDESLPIMPLLTSKDNFQLTLAALDFHLKKYLKESINPDSQLSIRKINAIINKLAIINRNIAANCNMQNCFDLLLLTLINQNHKIGESF